jgi:ppGpp synthetase/RelA/SpoT-type nucleotidyltranferase
MKKYSSVAEKMINRCIVHYERTIDSQNDPNVHIPPLITVDNFFNPESGVADLAGIRILHIKKGSWKKIHEVLTSHRLLLNSSGRPSVELHWKRAYVKSKDIHQYRVVDKKNCFEESEIIVKDTGYSSLHYVFRDITRFLEHGRDLCLECQVRTVFDEGWGEISHELDYPRAGHSIYQGHLAVLNATTAAANEVTAALEALQDLPVFIPWGTEQQLERSAKEVHCLTPSLEWTVKYLDENLENCDRCAGDVFYYIMLGHPEVSTRIRLLNQKLREKGLDDRVKIFTLGASDIPYPVVSDILWLHDAVDPKTSCERDFVVIGGPPPPSDREEEQLDMLITDLNMIKRLQLFFTELRNNCGKV